MSYSSVFCVKCKSHTDALDRHTIQLSNNRKALKGVCPICATETYRFMPDKGQRETQLSLISSQRKLTSSAATPKRSVLVGNIGRGRTMDFLSRIEYPHYGLADKLLQYGVLLILFGLSVIIGYLVCAQFLPK